MIDALEFVETFEGGKQKFLVAEISDQNGCKKIVVWTGSPFLPHREIHDKIKEKFCQHDYAIEVLGGGMIRDDEEIVIYDYSTDYGREPDRNLTVEIIKRTHPNRAVIVEQEYQPMGWLFK